MPVMNVTLDDISRQIRYFSTGADTWIRYHYGMDDMTPQYFAGTFHATKSEGDGVEIKFRGSAICVYGALRGNHGYFSTQLDSGPVQYQLGMQPSTGPQIQALLYSQGGLSTDMDHSVTFINLPSLTKSSDPNAEWWFDLDYVVVSTSVPDEIYTTTFDDTSGYINYQGSGWATTPPSQPEKYHNTTAHITSGVGDAMSLRFNGSSIQVFGGIFPDHSNYTVALDGKGQGTFSGEWFELEAQATLFWANGLKDGPHELLFTNTGGAPNGRFFDFDYAVVNSTINPDDRGKNATVNGASNADRPPNSAADNVDSDSDGSSNVGAIAGGVAGGVIALLLLGLLAWFLSKKHRKHGSASYHAAGHVDLTGEEVKPYVQNTARGHDPNLDLTPEMSYVNVSRHTPTVVSRDGNTTAGPNVNPFLSAVPPPPVSTTTSYPHSINPPSSVGMSPTTEDSGHYDPSTLFYAPPVPSSGTNSDDNRSQAYGLPASTFGGHSVPASSPPADRERHFLPSPLPSKGMRLTLPFTAQPPSASTDLSSPRSESIQSPGASAGHGRIQREGREVDIGPLHVPLPASVEADDEGIDEVTTATLPPDYQQATEPLPGQRSRDGGRV